MAISNSNNPYQGTSCSAGPSHTISSGHTTIGIQKPARLMNQFEYEFFVEAKNLITDMAQDEELSAGYRKQAKRLVARLVMRKL